MKVVILAGGVGSRLSEETYLKPKPMIEIGDRPILWHIMKIYSHYGYNDFIICLGYKSFMIKQYFANYCLYNSDTIIDTGNNTVKFCNKKTEGWKVTLVDTGIETMTGGRIKKIQPYIENKTFMLTYGDGVGNVNIEKLVKFHKANKKYATVTTVQPFGRFGVLEINSKGQVTHFHEKPKDDATWINGGFFVLEPKIFDYIEGDNTLWEEKPLKLLSKNGKLCAYRHKNFWMCMDTLRDKQELEKLWNSGNPPWKIWGK
ncbi:MAG: glucose-1-phosphate cytidylyltransferase [Candidatus Omnitrophica bacterium]|jgi:glucose-1-phosphate cytidylyltransferase|nr:glucose-1-phosphate cytidylyltransferase [Candidatus Omnitrophota bacterium]